MLEENLGKIVVGLGGVSIIIDSLLSFFGSSEVNGVTLAVLAAKWVLFAIVWIALWKPKLGFFNVASCCFGLSVILLLLFATTLKSVSEGGLVELPSIDSLREGETDTDSDHG